MKTFYFLALFVFINATAYSQINNPSFEENGNVSLEYWAEFCTLGSSENEGAPGNGDWSLKLEIANVQGACLHPEFYQVLPDVNSGDHLVLTGWIKSSGNTLPSMAIGIIDPEGQLLPIVQDSTGSTEWGQYTVETDVILAPGDNAVIILSSGITGGPSGGPDYYGLFDGLELSVITSVIEESRNTSIHFYPNPVTNGTVKIKTNIAAEEFQSISIFNCLGKKIQHYSAYQESFDLHEFSKGIYFIETITKKGSQVKAIFLEKP